MRHGVLYSAKNKLKSQGTVRAWSSGCNGVEPASVVDGANAMGVGCKRIATTARCFLVGWRLRICLCKL